MINAEYSGKRFNYQLALATHANLHGHVSERRRSKSGLLQKSMDPFSIPSYHSTELSPFLLSFCLIQQINTGFLSIPGTPKIFLFEAQLNKISSRPPHPGGIIYIQRLLEKVKEMDFPGNRIFSLSLSNSHSTPKFFFIFKITKHWTITTNIDFSICPVMEN